MFYYKPFKTKKQLFGHIILSPFFLKKIDALF